MIVSHVVVNENSIQNFILSLPNIIPIIPSHFWKSFYSFLCSADRKKQFYSRYYAESVKDETLLSIQL